MEKWEYLATRIADQDFQAMLNQLGDEGWELVSTERTEGEMVPDEAAGSGYLMTPSGYRAIFKRRKQS